MQRIFLGLSIPDEIAGFLSTLLHGIPDAKWVHPQNLHITMKFIGEIPESDIERIAEALEEISFHKFNLNVKGTFLLDSPKGYALCAGFSEIPVELSEMNRKITSLLSRLGVRTDQKKFIAHITLARLKRSNSTRLETYLNEFQEIQSSSFSINEFHLFLSELHPNGAVHSILRSYPAS